LQETLCVVSQSVRTSCPSAFPPQNGQGSNFSSFASFIVLSPFAPLGQLKWSFLLGGKKIVLCKIIKILVPEFVSALTTYIRQKIPTHRTKVFITLNTASIAIVNINDFAASVAVSVSIG